MAEQERVLIVAGDWPRREELARFVDLRGWLLVGIITGGEAWAAAALRTRATMVLVADAAEIPTLTPRVESVQGIMMREADRRRRRPDVLPRPDRDDRAGDADSDDRPRVLERTDRPHPWQRDNRAAFARSNDEPRPHVEQGGQQR